MVHKILPRAIALAFGGKAHEDRGPGPVGDAEPEEGDLREVYRKKVKKAVTHAMDVRQVVLHAFISWASKPIDDLWHHTCSERSPPTIADMARDTNNPVTECIMQLSAMLDEPLTDGPLGFVWAHFMSDANVDDQVYIALQLFKRLSSTLAQLHTRLVLPFKTWPYKLVAMVDEEQEDLAALRQRTFEEFMSEPVCCLDEHFSHKLRVQFLERRSSLPEGDDHAKFLELYLHTLSIWSTHTQLSNMSIERLLARCKKSVPEACPNLERFLTTSYLSEWLGKHLHCEGQDPRQAARMQKLQQDGVDLPAARKHNTDQKTPKTQGANGLCTYIRDHMPSTARTASARLLQRRRFLHLQNQRRLRRHATTHIEKWSTSRLRTTLSPDSSLS